MPGLPMPEVPLGDGVAVLVPLSHRHTVGVNAALHDPGVRRFNHAPAPGPGVAWRDISRRLARWAAGRSAHWAILDAEGRFCGRCSVYGFDTHRESARIGYYVLAGARGRRLAARAVQLAARWAFTQWGLVRLQANIDLDNIPSYRTVIAAGMHHEGVARLGGRLRDGGRVDQHRFSLLAQDMDHLPVLDAGPNAQLRGADGRHDERGSRP